jgi:AcrR family transcriptional regulator
VFNERMTVSNTRGPRGPRSDAARNHEALVRAATAAVHREGPHVSMATIAADAGVGIGTLYRHFRTREELLGFLAHRSFERVLANATAAERVGATGGDALRRFIEAAIGQRNELVLPLHGGPPVTADQTLAVRDEVHRTVQRIIDRGRADGTIGQDVAPRDVVVFGAMLAQPRPPDPGWDATCRRLLGTYINGLRGPRPALGDGADGDDLVERGQLEDPGHRPGRADDRQLAPVGAQGPVRADELVQGGGVDEREL